MSILIAVQKRLPAKRLNTQQLDSRRSISMHASNAKGFTIIELMITIALLAIVSSIAVPSFNSIVEESAVSTTSDDLMNAIGFARGQAMGGRNDVVLCAVVDINVASPACGNGSSWGNGWVVRQDSLTGSIIATYPISAGVTIEENNSVKQVTFDRRLGQASDLNLAVYSSNSQNKSGFNISLLRSGLSSREHVVKGETSGN